MNADDASTPSKTQPTLLTTPRRHVVAAPPSLASQKIGAGRIQAVLLGAAGVGKTALAQRILGQDGMCSSRMAPTTSPAGASKYSGAPPPTVGVDFATRSVALDGGTAVRLHLWDTSGQERFRELGETYLTELEAHDAVIVVYAASDAGSLEEACEHARRARRLTKGTVQMALVATKADVGPRE